MFAPKYRRKVFYEEHRQEVREILRKLCEWKGVEIIEGEVCAEVNGTKPKSLRTGQEMPYKQQKSRERSTILTRLLKSFISVFSNDFATVDVREELCYHSRPKKTNPEGLGIKNVQYSEQI